MAEVKLTTDPVANQLREKYPSNSYASKNQPQKAEREKIQPVVKSTVMLQKETVGEKIKKMFLPGDIKDIRTYAVNQVIIPGIKTGILAVLELMFFNRVSGRSMGQYKPTGTNYAYISSNQSRVFQPSRPSMDPRDRATHNFRNVVFATYQDAEDVISTLLDLVDRCGVATVADFYEACNLESDWASVDWGWTSFQKLESMRTRDGYVINIQPPVQLR